MRYFGYPCMYIAENKKDNLTTSHTLRLNSVTYEKWVDKCRLNIQHLKLMIEHCVREKYKIFRIGSGVIPFATHEATSDYDWKTLFKDDLHAIGDIIRDNNMRITMHPDHFVKLNALDDNIYRKSVLDLQYHCDLMDMLKLDNTCKMQIHSGGVYGNKQQSINRWIERYHLLSDSIKNRLVLENDDVSYSFEDVMIIHNSTKIPILFDTLHHECLNTNNINHVEAFKLAKNTWLPKDGAPLIDYSSQQPGGKRGKHSSIIDINHFFTIKQYLDSVTPIYDVILEIKDKNISGNLLRNTLLTNYKIINFNELSTLRQEDIVSFNFPPEFLFLLTVPINHICCFTLKDNTNVLVELFYNVASRNINPPFTKSIQLTLK